MIDLGPPDGRPPALAALLERADHVDVELVEGEVPLREFLAGMFSWSPAWLRGLYAVRWLLVRLLGMRQEGIPGVVRFRPSEIPMTPGDALAFFTVEAAEEERYWIAGATERHLSAYLAVTVEPLARGRRFRVVTVVHHHHWTGPVYFAVIRPFHHLVVRRMARAGARYGRGSAPRAPRSRPRGGAA